MDHALLIEIRDDVKEVRTSVQDLHDRLVGLEHADNRSQERTTDLIVRVDDHEVRLREGEKLNTRHSTVLAVLGAVAGSVLGFAVRSVLGG